MTELRQFVCTITITMPPNYALYLVTDSTKAILGEKDLAWVVEQAIQGGPATSVLSFLT